MATVTKLCHSNLHLPSSSPPRVLLYPVPGSKHSFTITTGDLDCLVEGEYLNDKIINFYLTWAELQCASIHQLFIPPYIYCIHGDIVPVSFQSPSGTSGSVLMKRKIPCTYLTHSSTLASVVHLSTTAKQGLTTAQCSHMLLSFICFCLCISVLKMKSTAESRHGLGTLICLLRTILLYQSVTGTYTVL